MKCNNMHNSHNVHNGRNMFNSNKLNDQMKITQNKLGHGAFGSVYVAIDNNKSE